MTQTASRTMQISTEEFMRQAPDGLGGMQHEIEDNVLRARDGDKEVVIRVQDSAEDVPDGSMDLPTRDVHFEFENFDQSEIDAFFERFDKHTLRFGGM